jgi:hypothetical protein
MSGILIAGPRDWIAMGNVVFNITGSIYAEAIPLSRLDQKNHQNQDERID